MGAPDCFATPGGRNFPEAHAAELRSFVATGNSPQICEKSLPIASIGVQ
jgi:hypothetical protein